MESVVFYCNCIYTKKWYTSTIPFFLGRNPVVGYNFGVPISVGFMRLCIFRWDFVFPGACLRPHVSMRLCISRCMFSATCGRVFSHVTMHLNFEKQIRYCLICDVWSHMLSWLFVYTRFYEYIVTCFLYKSTPSFRVRSPGVISENKY